MGPQILSSLSEWVRFLLACSGIALGLLVCCLGLRVVKLCAFVLGLGIGGVCGAVVAWRLSFDDKTTLISGCVTGLVVGLLCVCVMKFGRYIAAAAIGFLPVFLFIQTGGPKVRTYCNVVH